MTTVTKMTWTRHLELAEDSAHYAIQCLNDGQLENASVRAQLATAHALIAQTLARHGR